MHFALCALNVCHFVKQKLFISHIYYAAVSCIHIYIYTAVSVVLCNNFIALHVIYTLLSFYITLCVVSFAFQDSYIQMFFGLVGVVVGGSSSLFSTGWCLNCWPNLTACINAVKCL